MLCYATWDIQDMFLKLLMYRIHISNAKEHAIIVEHAP